MKTSQMALSSFTNQGQEGEQVNYDHVYGSYSYEDGESGLLAEPRGLMVYDLNYTPQMDQDDLPSDIDTLASLTDSAEEDQYPLGKSSSRKPSIKKVSDMVGVIGQRAKLLFVFILLKFAKIKNVKLDLKGFKLRGKPKTLSERWMDKVKGTNNSGVQVNGRSKGEGLQRLFHWVGRYGNEVDHNHDDVLVKDLTAYFNQEQRSAYPVSSKMQQKKANERDCALKARTKKGVSFLPRNSLDLGRSRGSRVSSGSFTSEL